MAFEIYLTSRHILRRGFVLFFNSPTRMSSVNLVQQKVKVNDLVGRGIALLFRDCGTRKG